MKASERERLAYLAGSIDADGYFSIKRSTYRARVKKDSFNPTYTPLVGLKQVTKEVPCLLKKVFGGSIYNQPPSTKNGQWLWEWRVVSHAAVAAAKALLPYLILKRNRAECLIEIQETISNTEYRKLSYWFELKNPDWRKSKLLTIEEAAKAIGYASAREVREAVANGTFPATPGVRGRAIPRVPEGFVLLYKQHMRRPKKQRLSRARPSMLIQWRDRIWNRLRLLNKIGIDGTCVTHRTGRFATVGSR